MSRNIKSQRLEIEDFESAFGEKLSERVKARILSLDLSFRSCTQFERDYCIRRSVDYLLDTNPIEAGEHRLGQWEDGWNENLKSLKSAADFKSIVPLYFGKYEFVRFKQDFIKVKSRDLEYNMLGVLLDWLFDKYLSSSHAVYEFGCGTGHNLLRARYFNSNAKMWGLDWTKISQEILDKYRSLKIDENIWGHRFDYFKPDLDFKLEKESSVYTVASLEQIGNKYQSFVKYLIEQKPEIVFHVEPIGEVLDQNNLLDYLSARYFEKRNYLKGYLDYLKSLEKDGLIEILDVRRSYIGSFFIDGYSIIVWRPLRHD